MNLLSKRHLLANEVGFQFPNDLECLGQTQPPFPDDYLSNKLDGNSLPCFVFPDAQLEYSIGYFSKLT